VATDIPELRESGGGQGVYIPATEEGLRRGILASVARGPAAPDRTLPSWEEEARKLAEALLS